MERGVCNKCARRWFPVAMLAASLVVTPALAESRIPGAAENPSRIENQSLAREGLFGASAAVASFAYGPFKIAYAVGGLVLGGLSYLWTWGNKDISGTVVRTALAGDYVVTPEVLNGAADIDFAGE